MIEMTETAQDVQQSGGAYVRYCRVESWLDGELLSDDVPISGGREEVDASARVPERLSFTVPRIKNGYDWSPRTDPRHPLAALGQRVRVMLGVGLAGREVEWIQRGEYLIQRTEVQGDAVDVEAVGLLALVDEARLVTPYQPTGTLASTLRGLVEPAVTVVFDAALVDRAVPAGINYDEDRLGAVLELLDAWPAEAMMNSEGYLYVKPPDTERPFALLSVGTTITAAGESDRTGAVNSVVARGTASDGAQVQGVAYEYGTGPFRYGGPFSPLAVPQFFASPLLTTVAQATAAARTRLARIQRERGLQVVVTAPPQIYLQPGDRVLSITLDQMGETLSVDGTVLATSLPLTAGDGAMTLTLVEEEA